MVQCFWPCFCVPHLNTSVSPYRLRFSCIASASYTFGCLLSAFHNRPVDVHACRVLGRGRCDFVFEFPLVSERGQSQNVSLQHLPHRSCLLGRRWLNHRSMHKHIMTIGGLCSHTIPTRRLYSVPLRSCAHFSAIADFSRMSRLGAEGAVRSLCHKIGRAHV